MNSINNTDNNDLYNFEYDSSISFDDYLSTLQTTIEIVFNKLSNSYPNYKLYPDVSEFENIYINDDYNLSSIKNSLFSFEQYINKSNNDLLDKIDNKNTNLNSLKEINKDLNQTYNYMINTDATSVGQQNEIREKYTENILSFILVLLFMFFFIILAYNYVNKNIQINILNKPSINSINNINKIK